MLARWVAYGVYQDGPGNVLAGVKHLSSQSDIAMTNLECVVSTRGKFWHKGEHRPFLYRARPETLDVLTLAGFDLVVTANNHSMDYGPEALLEELELLDAAGMAQVGSGRNKKEAARPTYIKTGHLIVAFIGFEPYFPACSAKDDSPGTFHSLGEDSLPETLKPLLEEARKHADLVVFTPHWGANWTENASRERIKLAHEIIDLGADAILGHSAHQLHGIEIYKGRPIVYDMGSFLFDNVHKNRMRKSAAFILTYASGGFTKLSIYPLLLYPSRTALAPRAERAEIKDLILRLSREIDPAIHFQDEGDFLSITFEPQPPSPVRSFDPEYAHDTGRTKLLPKAYRERKTNVVFDLRPDWTSGFKPVLLQRHVVVLGARHSEAVRPERGFTAEVALLVPGPLKDGIWAASIKGMNRETGESFIWQHPIADGGWMPPLWKSGQIVVDRTFVRPPSLAEGNYDLFFRLEDISRQVSLRPKDPASGDPEGYVRIGEIMIKTEGIPDGPSGVAWDGRLISAGQDGATSNFPALVFKSRWWIAAVVLVCRIGGFNLYGYYVRDVQ